MAANQEIEDLYALMKARDAIAQNIELQRKLEKQLAERDVRNELVLKERTEERRMVEQALEDRRNLGKSLREQYSIEYNLKIQEVSHGISERIKSVQERYPGYQQQLAELRSGQQEITPLKDTIEAIQGKPDVGFTGNSSDFPGDPREQARRMYADAARDLREHVKEQTVSQYMQRRWEAQQASHHHERPNSPGRARFASDSSGDNVAEIYKKERESIQQEKAREITQERNREHNL